MGRTLFLDCFSGISGDMFLGALIDLGAPLEGIKAELAALPVEGYRVEAERRAASGILGTAFRVYLEDAAPAHGHGHAHPHLPGHGHEHEHEGHSDAGHDHDHAHEHESEAEFAAHGRSYADIASMLDAAPLSPAVRRGAQAVFLEIGRAEAAVHGVHLEDVHFHEVGAVDSIVDIVGGLAALHLLGVDRIVCSPLSDGSGTIRSRHGVIPVPVPAVVKMLEGTDIPYRTGTADTELVTPTGMGLVKVLSSAFGPLPALRVERTGYGLGTREIGRLNALRAVLGTPADAAPGTDRVVVLECQIDDSTPEALGHAAERLMAEGALDVAFVPAFMKKWRPAVMVTVVCRPEDETRCVRLLFAETGTIGVRRRDTERHVMARETAVLETDHGPVRVKRLAWNDVRKATPEYEDLKRYAAAAGLSLPEAARRIGARLDEAAPTAPAPEE